MSSSLCMAIAVLTIFVSNAVNGEILKANTRDEKCGETLTWSFNSGTLRIEGTGPMYNYNLSVLSPWYEEKNEIIHVEIEEGVTLIGDYAFYRCNYLSELSLPNNLTSIGRYAFCECSSLTEVEFPALLTSIGDSAFYSSNLTQLILPPNVTSIGNLAFGKCLDLTHVLIPANVVSVGGGAFCFCSSLLSIDVEVGNSNFRSVAGVLFDFKFTRIIQYPAGITNSSYTIPVGVLFIGDYCFAGCDYLFSVEIPDSVTSIEYDAFYYCGNLKNVNIPSRVASIANGALSNCKSLATISIPPSVTSIGDGAFFGSGLTRVDLPDGITSIEGGTFSCCSNLTHVTIPSSVKSISGSAFSYCSHLTTVTIMDGLESIESGAFGSCVSLNNLVLPDSVKYIASSAFGGCYGLSHLTIPASVISIGNGAFSGSTNLLVVFYQGFNNSLSELKYAFDGCPNLRTVCVPLGYNSTQFCGLNVTPENELCQTFQKMFNGCSIPVYKNDNFVEQKRKNATDWEGRSDACMEYKCDSKDGFVSWSICNSSDKVSHICVKNQCVKEDRMEDKVYVEIEMDGVKVIDANVTELLETISTLCKVSVDQLKIGYEVDNNGFIIRIIVYVNDDETAKIVANMIESLDKGTTCEAGILCKNKAVHIVLSSHSLSGVAQIDVMITNIILLLLMTMNVFAQSLE